MPTYLRLYQSAVDPSDVAEVRRLFDDDVVGVFSALDGCLSVELLVSVEKNAGGLVEGAVVTRWASLEAMEEAVASRAVQEAIVRFRGLLRQEPLARVYEIAG
ncbi:MAG: antibiotic biosynthesis monooxygenase [Actinomycetota bacterium]|jgi:quinol monooxygenase YgiN